MDGEVFAGGTLDCPADIFVVLLVATLRLVMWTISTAGATWRVMRTGIWATLRHIGLMPPFHFMAS